MKLIDWDIDGIADKLETLNPDSMPLWGKMNAGQMLKHLIDIAQISNEKRHVAFANKDENLPKLRHILYKEVPFPQSFPAPPEVESFMGETTDLPIDVLKEQLILELKDFESSFNDENKTVVNAVFGPLNMADWMWFHRKHISHHLAQFGLWEY